LIATRELEGGKVQYSEFRDAYYRLKPTTSIARKMMEKGLVGQQYFSDVDGSFIVVGQDAIERAIERNDSASRPMVRGVISPREKNARRILRHIFKEILGSPLENGEKLVYSVPAGPVDQSPEDFDVGWHQDALGNDLKDLGYSPSALSEGEAVCYSELEVDDYSGLCISMGSGMANICLMSSGEGVLHFSVTKSGDFVDRMAAQATGTPDTVVQVEKEHGEFIIGQEVKNNPILSAVSLYYCRLIDYVVQHMFAYILRSPRLPKFSKAIPIVLAGGTSLAKGFTEHFRDTVEKYNSDEDPTFPSKLPFEIKEIRPASDPLRAVAKGLLIASHL
jgi:hypothetical protein